MRTEKIPCPCGGTLQLKKDRVIQDGIDGGILEVEVCTKCETQYLPEESMLIVEEKLKKAGLWGVERKEIKLWKTGNTFTVRFPTSIVQNADIPEKGYIYREGRSRFVIEV